MRRRAPRSLAVLLAAILAIPAQAGSAAGSAGTGRVRGEVRDASGEPLGGVRVVLAPLDAQGKEYAAQTDARGRYSVSGLPYGYYRCVLLVGDRPYPGNRVLLVPPGKKVQADWTIGPATARDQLLGLEPGRPVALAGGSPAAGVAHLVEPLGPTGLRWLTRGRGALVLLGGATALVAGIILLSGGDETVVSPSSP
ncbi:MAG: carboxypeptidase regulatory-like domain-containing protein [Acidobacteria bacterium]|nr:MAG: carboxypeptidase regulatory-like domain-containing protein [Acidobacteriota bacterium]